MGKKRTGALRAALLVTAVLAFLSGRTSGAPVDVRVATFNIENLDSTAGPQFASAVAVLERICADVVCVQEMGSEVITATLASAAGYPHVEVASTVNAIDGNLRVAILSQYPFSSVTTATSPLLSGDPSAMDMTRNFLVGVIDVPGAVEDLVLVTGHWKAGNANEDEFRRSIEAFRVLQSVSGYESNTVPYLITGDLNDDINDSPDSPVQFFSEPSGLPISFDLGNDISFPVLNSVFNPLLTAPCDMTSTVVSAFQLDGNDATRNSSGRRLDYLFNSATVTIIGAEVYDSADEGIGGGLPKCGSPLASGISAAASDHLPVFADIQIPGDPFTGACCIGEALCEETSASGCACAGGTFFSGQSCLVVDCGEPPDVVINEIRVDQPGGDLDEYFELEGAPGTDLSALTYVVLGDDPVGTFGSGVVEAAISLSGQSIGPSGYFVAAEASFSLGTPDFEVNLPFENADNVTHFLVASFAGSEGDDLDTNDDGVLDIQPWSQVVDVVALIAEENPPSGTEYHYGPPTVGPDGGVAPSLAIRCSDAVDGWRVGDATLGVEDTPGAGNDCPGACCSLSGCDDVGSVAACDALLGEFQGLGTDCGSVSCPPFGACCIGGVCQESVSAPSCDAQNGAYQGDGSTCDGVTCPDGACCYFQHCQDGAAAATCESTGGSYLGDGATCAEGCPATLHINEIRIDGDGASDEEYFELVGTPGASLDGLTYVVIGDGAAGSGSIEAIVDLDGLVMPPDGYFLAAESGFALATPDAELSLNFEDGDNVTHLLVAGFTGSLGGDLDTDDNGTLDETPWAAEIDRIALIEEENPPSGTEFHYGPPTVGPDGVNVPSHVYRCGTGGDVWLIGSTTPTLGIDTPGTANPCPLGACCVGAACLDTTLEGNCTGQGGTWFSLQTCDEVACASIPAAGTWGIVILGIALAAVATVILVRRDEPREGGLRGA